MKITSRWGRSFEQRGRLLRTALSGDRAFYALLALATVGGLALLGFVVSLVPLYVHEFANLCRRSWSVLAAHLPAAGAAAPLLGLAFVFGRGGLSLIRQLRETRRFLNLLPAPAVELPAQLSQMAIELGISDHLDLIPDSRAFSFCYGLLRPRICVTTGLLALLDDAELRALLLHERHHWRQRDPLRILLSEVAADAMGVLPIARLLARRHRVAQEVAADQAAIAGSASDVPLSSALLKLLTTRQGHLHIPSAVGAFSPALSQACPELRRGIAGVTEERIARLVYGEVVLFVS